MTRRRVYFDDTLHACRNIQRSTADLTFEQFRESQMTIDAVARNLTIIGEATKNIQADLRARLSEIDWRGVAGFRDVLVNRYFDVDVDLMWQIITERIPPFAAAVEAFLNAT